MIKYLAYSLVLLPFILISCKNTGDIGVKIRPGEDSLRVLTASFPVKSKTVPAGGIYSETEKPVLGFYIDNIYGGFQVDFLSEFRYVRNLTFESGAKSDSLYLVMYYKSFFGDSASVQEATVYQLDKQALDFSTNYNSDIKVEDFCSKNIVLGSRTYTAYDKTLSDDQRKADNYCNVVRVKMPQTLADELISKTDIYKSQDDFVNFFKGVYVTNTYGQQTVLEIDSVNLELSYNYIETLQKVTGGDSLVTRYKKVLFPSNRETTQVVHVESYLDAAAFKPDSIEVISSPGGTFVELEIPFETIYKEVVEKYQLANDSLLNFNHFSLLMEPAILPDTSFRISTPIYFILVRKADMQNFFVQSLYPAPNINTTLGVYNSTLKGYTFANSGAHFEDVMLKASRKSESERKDYFKSLNPYMIVPISGATDIEGTNATVRHMFDAYGIRVRSGENEKSPMRVVVTFTNL